MKSTRRPFLMFALSLAFAVSFSLFGPHELMPRIASACARAWRVTRDFFVETAAHVLSLFAPTGVFALALQRAASAVKVSLRALRGAPASTHYRAPGSWVSCASV